MRERSGSLAHPALTPTVKQVRTVGIGEAKTHFSKLLRAVEAGEQVVVCRRGTPVAVIRRYEPPPKPRRPGRLRGRFFVADDFDPIPREFADHLSEHPGVSEAAC